MNKLILLSIVILLIASCKKDDTVAMVLEPIIQDPLEYSDSIIAGITEGTGIHYSGILNEIILFDYPSSSDSLDIDINNDGIYDFRLEFSGSGSPGHRNSNNYISTIGNSYIVRAEKSVNYVDTLIHNHTIDDEMNWSSGSHVLYDYYWDISGAYSSYGLWKDSKDKYIGTKIIVEDQVLYGWIRIEIPLGWNLTLVDYACSVGY